MGSTLSHGLLQGMGWYLPADYHLNRVAKSKRLIVVISHTSYWDFFILLLLRQCDERIRKNLHIVIKPQPFAKWGWFLRPLGAIPATQAEKKGEGFVKRTVKRLKGKNFRLIISPEGMMESTPWRSGYYWLCRGLEADIVIAGVDYEAKTMYIGPVHSWTKIKDMDRKALEKQLQAEMGEIVALHPKCSHTPITRGYDKSRISATDPYPIVLTVIAIILIIIIIVLVVRGLRKKKS